MVAARGWEIAIASGKKKTRISPLLLAQMCLHPSLSVADSPNCGRIKLVPPTTGEKNKGIPTNILSILADNGGFPRQISDGS